MMIPSSILLFLIKAGPVIKTAIKAAAIASIVIAPGALSAGKPKGASASKVAKIAQSSAGNANTDQSKSNGKRGFPLLVLLGAGAAGGIAAAAGSSHSSN